MGFIPGFEQYQILVLTSLGSRLLVSGFRSMGTIKKGRQITATFSPLALVVVLDR